MAFLQPFLPDIIPLWVAVILVFTSFFTSAITATFGIGGGVAMLVVMGLFMPVASLIPVHGLVQLGSNTGRAWRMRADIGWTILLPFLIGGTLGAVLGAAIVVELPNNLLRIFLGVFVIFVTWFSLPKSFAGGKTVIAIGGFISTVLTMFLGATGPLVIALLQRLMIFANSSSPARRLR